MDEREQLRAWAAEGSEDLATHAEDRAWAYVRPDFYDDAPGWPHLDRLPRVLALPFRVRQIEIEWLNGGFTQYFWNGKVDWAPETVEDLKLIGAAAYAAALQEALDRYLAVAPEFERFREQGSSAYEEAIDVAKLDEPAVDLPTTDYGEGSLSAMVAAWLADRVEELADALEALGGA